jgi:hypothetical protein
MAEVPVDLTKVQVDDAIPEGEYLVQVNKCEYVDSKRTAGNKNLKVEMTIQEGEFHGRKLYDDLSLSEKALWRVTRFVNACGVYPQPTGFRTEDLLGATLYCSVKNEPRMQMDPNGNLIPANTLRSRPSEYRSK